MKESFYDGSYHGFKVRIRMVRENGSRYKARKIKCSGDVYSFLKCLENEDREKFIVLLLDSKVQVIGVEETSVGSLDQATVHPREVFKAAILANARSIICVHNHPSGDPKPSEGDKSITLRLKDCGELLDIKMLDSIIIGNGNYFSFDQDSSGIIFAK